MVSSSADNLVIYALPQDAEDAANLLQEMRRVTEFYLHRFGPTKNVNGYTAIEIPEGYGSQAADLYMLLDAAAFKDVSQVYHEIAHSWNVQAKPGLQRTRWFDEAFASYFQALAIRQFQGQQAFEAQMTHYRERFRRDAQKDARNATTPIANYGKDELGENSYTKGAWSLFLLEKIVGEDVFNQIVRTFLNEYSERPASFQDFTEIASRISGRDLSHLFQEWLFGAESSTLLLGGCSTSEIVQRYR